MSILCDTCAYRAHRLPDLVPSQIQATSAGLLNACLVDGWGRSYRLSERTEIGRETPNLGITIHQGSVSRRHAVLVCESSGRCFVEDLSSTNGTIVAGQPTSGSVELTNGTLIFFGSVGFYFVTPMPPLTTANLSAVTPRTGDRDFVGFREQNTDVIQLKELQIHVMEATGGGGGIVMIAGQQIKVPTSQLELLMLLIKRMQSDRGMSDIIRGYVHTSEIVAAVGWDTPHPAHDHVKHLVRRLRRTLARSGRDDLIESEQGLGYRLSVIATKK